MAPLLGLLALFFLITARYGAGLNLWGDEAYSLNVAAKSVGEILAADPFHLPTYYLLLHPVVGFFPAGNELPLRLIHALIFSIGLGFCWRIARLLLGRGWALLGVMMLTILLPNYIFYATNIRMYALLFAASMALLWTAFRLLTPGTDKRRAMAWHLLAALLCALVDWPGLLLVGITWLALLLLRRRWLLARGWCNGRTVAVLGALAATAALLLREPLMNLVVAWPSSARAAAAGGFGVGALAKTLFFSSRPLLDLVYPPVYPLLLNLLLWLLLVLAVCVAAVVLWRGGRRAAAAGGAAGVQLAGGCAVWLGRHPGVPASAVFAAALPGPCPATPNPGTAPTAGAAALELSDCGRFGQSAAGHLSHTSPLLPHSLRRHRPGCRCGGG